MYERAVHVCTVVCVSLLTFDIFVLFVLSHGNCLVLTLGGREYEACTTPWVRRYILARKAV